MFIASGVFPYFLQSTEKLSCTDDKPLLCSKSEGCCARGLPYSCDGLCYSGPVGPCVESDFCTFNVKGLTIDSQSTVLFDPVVDNEPMYSTE